MVRVGLLSDSHGDEFALDQLLERMGYLDAICFMGDIARDAMHLQMRADAMPNRPPLYAVRGNNDLSSILPDSRIAEFGGKRAYITHGHMCVSPLSLAYRALQNECDIALFGHTHQVFYENVQGVLLINPGSAGNYVRGGRARGCVLEITGERMRVLDVSL